jgi:hypothetical protein
MLFRGAAEDDPLVLVLVTGAQSSFFTVNVPTQVQELVKARPRWHADNVYQALITEQLTGTTSKMPERRSTVARCRRRK